MINDLSIFEFPDDVPNFEKEEKLVCRWINKINTHNHAQKRLLIITDWEIFLFRKKNFKDILQLSRSFKWTEVTKITNLNARAVSIFYKTKSGQDSLTFREPDALDILYIIYKFFAIRYREEDFPEFEFTDDFKPPRGLHKDIKLFIHHCIKKRGHKVSQSVKNTLDSYFNSKPSAFRLDEIRPIIEYLNDFLSVLHWEPNITTLVVPCQAGLPVTELLETFFHVNNTVSTIIFRGSLPEDFINIARAYAMSEPTAIDTMVFEYCDFTLRDMTNLASIFKNRPCTHLRLTASLPLLVVSNFLLKCNEIEGFQQLQDLRLEKTPGISIATLLKYMGNLRYLSVAESDFEISDFLTGLSLSSNAQFEVVNISRNRCTKSIGANYPVRLPPTLHTLIAEDILWDPDVFSKLTHATIQHTSTKGRIQLNVNRAHLLQDKWSSILSEFKKIKSDTLQLHCLQWEENPIDSDFLSFLSEKCPHLRMLSLSGCFETGSGYIDQLIQLVKSTTTLELLAIKGTPNNRLKDDLSKILEALEVNRSIRRIDISNNMAGAEMLLKLSDVLMANRLIENVILDGNDIHDIEDYIKFCMRLRQRGTKLFVPFPQNEVNEMLQYATATEAQERRMKQLFSAIAIGDAKIEVPIETIQLAKADDVSSTREIVSESDEEYSTSSSK